MKKRFIRTFSFLKQVAVEFSSDNVLKYSASLAYYTVFSLAPMLIIIIAGCGILFGRDAMEGRVYAEIKDMVGSDAALQVQEIIKNVHLTKNTTFATIISVIVLVIGATGIFGEIQDSLNKIWGLKLKNHKVWWKLIINRLLSFSLIISFGFVLMVSLVLNALVVGIGDRLDKISSGYASTMIPLVNSGLTLVVNTLVFATIFKVLPDARIKWKDVFVGSIITSVLFMLGKWGIGYYLGKSNMANLYGAAGSIIIILIWTYYSSAILYLGAVVTKVYAKDYGGRILPNEYSVWIKTEEKPVANVTLSPKAEEEIIAIKK